MGAGFAQVAPASAVVHPVFVFFFIFDSDSGSQRAIGGGAKSFSGGRFCGCGRRGGKAEGWDDGAAAIGSRAGGGFGVGLGR